MDFIYTSLIIQATTTIGYDYSGNANEFTRHDVQVSDSVPDTPTNAISVMMSGLNKNSGLSHGNLQFYEWNASSAALAACHASMDVSNTGEIGNGKPDGEVIHLQDASL